MIDIDSVLRVNWGGKVDRERGNTKKDINLESRASSVANAGPPVKG